MRDRFQLVYNRIVDPTSPLPLLQAPIFLETGSARPSTFSHPPPADPEVRRAGDGRPKVGCHSGTRDGGRSGGPERVREADMKRGLFFCILLLAVVALPVLAERPIDRIPAGLDYWQTLGSGATMYD